jgi:hypothetical protein
MINPPRPQNYGYAPVAAVSSSKHSIIHASNEDVTLYLRNIHMLWFLGAKTNTAMMKYVSKNLLPEQEPAARDTVDKDIEF